MLDDTLLEQSNTCAAWMKKSDVIYIIMSKYDQCLLVLNEIDSLLNTNILFIYFDMKFLPKSESLMSG